MTTKLVKLDFTAPVHFGGGRLSDSGITCAADTLFSALFIEALAQGSHDELLTAARSGDLLLSDAFPRIGDTYYLPKPYAAPSLGISNDAATASDSVAKKAFKRLRFVPIEAIASFFDGTIDASATQQEFRDGVGGSGLTTKVNLQREESDDAKPYHVGGFRFNVDAGLYFLVRGGYDLEPLLETLQYSGLGGKRSAGYGRFEYKICEGAFPSLDGLAPQSLHVLLSTAAPTAAELADELLDGASYSLSKRSGFVQSGTYAVSPLKKRDFYAFAAGSTFARTFDGDVFDVSVAGAHPVWRYAKAFWMEG